MRAAAKGGKAHRALIALGAQSDGPSAGPPRAASRCIGLAPAPACSLDARRPGGLARVADPYVIRYVPMRRDLSPSVNCLM